MNKLALLLPILALSLTAFAGNSRQVSNASEYQVAILEACADGLIGSACTVEFAGGTIGVGICEITAGTGKLECSINLPELAESCKNSAFLNSPSSALAFIGLLGGLFAIRLRHRR